MAQTDARRVADWFLWRAAQENKSHSMTNMKLQKLVYYAQAWNLAFSHKPLFDDPIEAWIHGPVVPDLYFEHRSSGWNPISRIPSEQPELNGDVVDHLQEVWDIYGGYDAKYLEALTHHEMPWQIAREGLEEDQRSNIEIDHDDMGEYYRSVLIESQNE